MQTNEERFIAGALSAWKGNLDRADKLFSNLSPEDLLKQVAPGRNRLIYLWGHLTAINDRLLPALFLGDMVNPAFDKLFVSSPDGTTEPPSTVEIKLWWDEVNRRLADGFASFTPADWLKRHALVSEEDFAREPHRNRFAILLGRTNHLSYHLGQALLTPK